MREGKVRKRSAYRWSICRCGLVFWSSVRALPLFTASEAFQDFLGRSRLKSFFEADLRMARRIDRSLIGLEKDLGVTCAGGKALPAPVSYSRVEYTSLRPNRFVHYSRP